MRYLLPALLLLITSMHASASDPGVTVSIGLPGTYGQINLGNQFPNPSLIYPNPVVAMPPATATRQQPVYLYVPPGHAMHWDKHCARYNACQQPVYFVQEEWYNNVYLPQHAGQQHPLPGNTYQRHDSDGSPGHRKGRRNSQQYRDSSDGYDDDDHSGRGKGKHHEKREHKEHKEHKRGNSKD